MTRYKKISNIRVLINSYNHHKSFYLAYRTVENSYRKVGHKTQALRYMIKANDHETEMNNLACEINRLFQKGK